MEDANEITAHLTSGAVVVYGIEWLKSRGWCPWITSQTIWVNRLASASGAFAAVMGISFSYDPSVGGDIHIPAATMLVTGLWDCVKQYVMQQMIYDGVVQQRGLPRKADGDA